MESIINNVIDTIKDIILTGDTSYLPFKSIVKEGLPRSLSRINKSCRSRVFNSINSFVQHWSNRGLPQIKSSGFILLLWNYFTAKRATNVLLSIANLSRDKSPKSISYTLPLHPLWITCISLFFRLERSRRGSSWFWSPRCGPTKTEERRKEGRGIEARRQWEYGLAYYLLATSGQIQRTVEL